ncbi:hypothetical protein DRO54_04500 [Candidatus Bathyarchaeota archaeon]|nr:MAG: hypothetical protein DRO54_04500 [Candidatus Bathyarchaeota archaeon]
MNEENESISIMVSEWLWIIIIALILITAFPLLVVWVIMSLPDVVQAIIVFCIIIGWGIVAGYKEWLEAKHERENKALQRKR